MKNALVLPLSRQVDIVVQELPDETLVYDLRTHKAHCLNQTADLVWKHCDGITTYAEMKGILETRYRTRISDEVVHYALERLDKAGLLQKSHEARVSLSRRELIKKAGIGAAILLPVVASIVAPEAVQAVSCIPCGGFCETGQAGKDCCPGTSCKGSGIFKQCFPPSVTSCT